jgi:hypothetical protein
MIKVESTDNLLDRAFNLACFIQRDRDSAIHIVAGALSKLELVATAQGKRLYYKPSGRRWSLHSQAEHFRNRISFNEAHLFQRLIYIEAEPYEIAQENSDGSNAAREEDLVIHFIKHLVRKTTKRNSFYVTLGLGRLLHSYTTAETMDIYNAVIQDPERVKDDFYFRSRKGALMTELKQRFGNMIKVTRGPRGEERFETDENPGRFVQLVRDCLNFFTPWNTPCLVPAGVDPIREGIPSLSFHGRHAEDTTEVNRIHALLHPDCFHRLITDLHFDAPDTRLNIPRFFYATNTNSNGSNGGVPESTLAPDELLSLKRELENNASRRKSVHAGVLSVLVDGNERASFDLEETRSTRFKLGRDAELIEVRSRDKSGKELVLALHPVVTTEDGQALPPASASITLEGGQKISISVSGGSGATVDITFSETNPFRAASLWLRQQLRLVGSASPQLVWNNRTILAPALLALILAVIFLGVIRFARNPNRTPLTPQDQVAMNHRTDALTGNENPSTAKRGNDISSTSSASGPSRQRQSVAPSDRGSSSQKATEKRPDTTAAPDITTEAGTETRGLHVQRSALPLSAIKKIYIEVTGSEISRPELSKQLSDRLDASREITLVTNRDDADALLQVTLLSGVETESKRSVTAELINRRGQVIWRNASSSAKYEGSIADVSTRIVNDLLAAIQNAKRTR